MKSSESTKGSKVSAKKLASKSVKAAAKVAAIKEKKIVSAAIKDTHMSGFIDFIREQGVVGLAVGLAIGTAAGDTVKKLVTAFIDPLVQLIVGSQQGLQSASFTVEVAGRKGEFLYGAFVSSLITLIAVAFVVYAIVHFLKLDKLDKKNG
ncbi:MscL family protein [Candidatus Nanosynbacter sp. TM7-075]|jgi:large conductance mechanosensitive channel protein|uniref:MscL family protein n=1 Tax=Candidatus Nanosynbacter sp. TM7-075 TaxID=2902633 RepID=UPI001FB6D412|nr:MscL family protein [Candidatus Nanosynbacter sp. TM7-075]MCJ1967215.1 MscL family protein [Candidatus Nanosynbacter sp. TM7-075]